MNSKQFGGKITAQWKKEYQNSPNWEGGSFKNLMPTQTAVNWRKLPGILCKQIKGHREGYPKADLPLAPLNKEQFLHLASSAMFAWYGHSVLLMRLNNKTILIDPMFGEDASPIAPKKTMRFSRNTLKLIDDLPEIDLMLITHDHYDHLDYDSISRLKPKVKNAFVAMGVKRHLANWGYDKKIIHEFDWWDSETFEDIHITFTPTRHFSGRSITSLAKCLWGGWALKTSTENIWFSGDGGYAVHFKEIGKRLGPFDIGFMECGQYCVDWPQIHMFPNESVQAALDAKMKVAMPVHWAGFNLSYQHSWYEPAEAFVNHARHHSLSHLTPSLGELFQVSATTGKWWQNYK
ncbi:MAG: membrane protein [Chitinophagales bacterium]|nr:MAG: membrane protein [Chitinophagales bacterium]